MYLWEIAIAGIQGSQESPALPAIWARLHHGVPGQQAADLIARIAVVMKQCGEEQMMGCGASGAPSCRSETGGGFTMVMRNHGETVVGGTGRYCWILLDDEFHGLLHG